MVNIRFFFKYFLIFSMFFVFVQKSITAETLSYFNNNVPSLAPMLEKVMPSVVSINIEGSTIVHTYKFPQQFFGDNFPFCQKGSPLYNSPLCKEFFNDESKHKRFKALGSGVIINSINGYVVTNNHVIDHATSIQVQLSDGRLFDAKIIGRDPRSDIALIQLIKADHLISIKIANSDLLKVGDYAVAIGNPFGFGDTVTTGIVSALGRSGLNIDNYENFIQTDAAINRGNSGGALVNLNGELIGINTAIFAPDGGNIGIGFAIPSNMVKNLTTQMVIYGHVKRGELGIMGTELNAELAKILNINVQKGAFVSQVLLHSSAYKSGIRAGDVIVSINNRYIPSFATLRAEIGSLPVCTKIRLGLIRNSKLFYVTVVLQQSKKDIIDSSTLYVGIDGANLSNYNNNGEKGVRVDKIKPDSSAYRIGLRKNDIILGINKQRVCNLNELREILNTKLTLLVFNIKRDKNNIYLLIQ
ncbi:HtrA protease/chaperone protein [Candidatus Purcelliella pentastirinorum]|uniref:peptidase Do n=2 Tax=Candidatus Purcelliella pentastirinorum TaxID=472834 RepID=A0A346DZE4_9ENTR|nr:HtrA protease/chaperone protein [Candidatus Purcelliella pentastirinorum]